jgi:deoxyribodipyrimidine photo-lyase
MLTDSKEGFLSKGRLSKYDTLRNKPTEDALSNMSAYFHFGQIAPQRAALEAAKHRSSAKVHPSIIFA